MTWHHVYIYLTVYVRMKTDNARMHVHAHAHTHTHTRTQVQSVLQYRAGLLTWLVALVILLFTVEFGLCCLAIIPFFIDDLKDVYHITPTDGKVVGVYKRLS